MKKVLFLSSTLLLFFTAMSAQIIKSNVPEGADPAAVSIQFLPADALVFPNGDVQMGVALHAKVRNIGTLPYLPGNKPLKTTLYKKEAGSWVEVHSASVVILNAGATVEFDYYTTYIKGKQKPPQFKLVVASKSAGVVNPDVNMNNNEKQAQAQ